MRYFILADLHGNLEALTAVLRDIFEQDAKLPFSPDAALANPAEEGKRARWRRRNPFGSLDRLICLGDLGGYGPDTVRLVEIAPVISDVMVAGNHDMMLRRLTTASVASVGDHSHSDALRSTIADFARRDLPTMRRVRSIVGQVCERLHCDEGFARFTHSPPFPDGDAPPDDDAYWANYVINRDHARELFFDAPGYDDIKICFAGHTHIPQYYGKRGDEIEGGMVSYSPDGRDVLLQPLACQALVHPQTFGPDRFPRIAKIRMERAFSAQRDIVFQRTIDLSGFDRTLVVVPSVGQPRDAFAYTGYAIYDPKLRCVTFRRFAYALKETQKKMMDKRLSTELLHRLAQGLTPEHDRMVKTERGDLIAAVNDELERYLDCRD